MNDALDAQIITSALGTRWLGHPVHFYPSVESTNDLLQALLAEAGSAGLPAGTMVITDFQRRGKGRLGRRWQVPAGTSLLLSLLFRPDWPANRAAWLTMIAGLAAFEAVQAATGLAVGLKWPNDLVVAFDLGAQEPPAVRKLGGLLLEGHFEGGRLADAILGTGLNVNVPAESLASIFPPATSLQVALGRPVSRLALLADYLERLEAHFEATAAGRSPLQAWKKRLLTLGQRVRATGVGLRKAVDEQERVSGSPDSVILGTAEDVDEWGRLLIRDDGGRLHRLSAGDVTLRSA